MGKPSDKQDPKDATDAVSLHTNPGESSREDHPNYDDFDAPEISIDDLPPNYSDAVESSEAASLLPTNPATTTRPHLPDGTYIEDPNTGSESYISRSLEDPEKLEAHIRTCAGIPPRPYVKLVGTHSETRKDSKGNTEKNTITDFDISVELTPYLYSDAQYRRSWSKLRTVENFEKAKRGTILKKCAPANQNIELGDTEPTLREWCHRYAASHAGLKVFTLQKRVIGLHEEYLKQRLRELVRDANYRGHLHVEILMKGATVDCYNEAKTNRWRLTKWIQVLFTVTLLFIFTWPYLWLRTKRWEVAIVEWEFSRIVDGRPKEYVSISEDQWYNMWGRTIFKAVLGKRQGLLDHADLRRAQEAEPAFDTGNSTVDGGLGLFRAGIHAITEVNRQLGWGGDC